MTFTIETLSFNKMLFGFKFLKLLENALPTKTFVITTKSKTKFIKITSLMQLILITFVLSFFMFFSIKYRVYTNNNDIAVLVEENEILKRENKQFENYYKTILSQIDKMNEYLGNADTKEKGHHLKQPTDINKIKDILDKKISFSYQSLNKRSINVAKKINELGLERLTYNRIQKVVKIEDNNNNTLLADIGSGNDSIGGKYEPVRVVKTAGLSPIISLPSNDINSKNFDQEVKKLIVAEIFLNTLPVGKPMKSDYRITSKFGIRSDPFEKAVAVHRGIDIVIYDKKIYAPADGFVVSAKKNTGYGNMIVIEHNTNKKELGKMSIKTRYGHLDKMLVKEGDYVKKNQLIAVEGSTGRSTAPHLHFETIINGQHVNPVYFINHSDNDENKVV